MKRKRKDNIDYEFILGADIETSRVPIDGGEEGKDDIQVPYLTNTREINIKTGEFTHSEFNRTIEEWINYLNSISSEDRMRIVYCHNLFYEITFIIRQLNASFVQMDDEEVNAYGLPMVDGIMRSRTNVVYCRLDCCPNIIFRDSQALFNKQLKSMGKDLSKRLQNDDYIKLDYNYKKVRMPWDELNEHDYKYNERDNEVVLMSLYYFLQDRGLTMEECPLTSTSDTKRARKKYIVDNHTEKHLKQINKNKQYIVNDYDFYSLLRGVYQGGFTGANHNIVDKMVKDVYSVDIKSSYPYQMVNNIFPVFHVDDTYYYEDDEANQYYYDFLHGLNHNQLQDRRNKSGVKGYYAVIELEKVKIRDDRYLLDLSLSHCIKEDNAKNFDGVKINGKIQSANKIGLFVNNVDLDRILLLYDYEALYVKELWTTKNSKRLPEGEIGFILDNFNIKENIDKKKEPVKYMLAKININAMYGVKVQNEVKDDINVIRGKVKGTEFIRLENDERKREVYENTIGKGNKQSGFKGFNFDVYSDGVYITSFARTMLQTMMVKLTINGFDVIYSDTDSLKFKIHETTNKTKTKTKNKTKNTNKKDIKSDNLNVHEKVIKLINDENDKIINSNMKNIRIQQYLEIKQSFDANKIYKLGTWDIESVNEKKEVSPYSYFKTLGAKKYAYIDHEGIHTTVAGCRKESFAKAITNNARYIFKTAHETEYKDIMTSVILNPVYDSDDVTESTIKILIRNHENNNEDNFIQVLSNSMDDIFTTGTLVDTSASGRTVAKYESRPYEECMELRYNGRLIGSAGGVIIEETTYKMNISKDDNAVLGEVERHEKWVQKININGHIEYNEENLEVE